MSTSARDREAGAEGREAHLPSPGPSGALFRVSNRPFRDGHHIGRSHGLASSPPSLPLGLCEPDHTARACPGLHFHLLVTGLDSEGGSSWETVIWGIRANSTGGSRQMPSSVRSWRLECW